MNQEFNEAKKRKEENLNSFVWRFKKEYTDNGPVQNEIKLVDCSFPDYQIERECTWESSLEEGLSLSISLD